MNNSSDKQIKSLKMKRYLISIRIKLRHLLEQDKKLMEETEEQKKAKKKELLSLMVYTLFISLLVGVFSFLLYYDSISDYKDIIKSQEHVIDLKNKSDALYLKETKKYSDVINRYVKNDVITFDGKSYSTADLIQKIYNLQFTIDTLSITSDVNKRNMLSYKSAHENNLVAYNKLSHDYSTSQKNYVDAINKTNSLQNRISRLEDSLSDAQWYLDIIKRQYGIGFNLKTTTSKKDSIHNVTVINTIISTTFSKTDSALMLYPYFKDRLHRNKDNFWVIDTYEPLFSKKKVNVK